MTAHGITRRAVLASALVARARPSHAGRRFRVVMLLWRGWEDACDGFRDYLTSRRIDVDYVVRDAARQIESIRAFVAEINRDRPDLVFIWGGITALAALGTWDDPASDRTITGVPCVLAVVPDPLSSRLVRSLESPGRDVTGTLFIAPCAAQLRVMTAYHEFRRLATLTNPNEPGGAVRLAELRQLATRSGLEVLNRPLPLLPGGQPDGSALPDLVRGFKEAGAEWLYIPPEADLDEQRGLLADAAMASRMPSFAATERFITYGSGLVGLVCRYYNVGRFAGFKAEQILVGGKRAAEIPLERLTRFSLLIRMETARRLELYPPLNLLRYAETV